MQSQKKGFVFWALQRNREFEVLSSFHSLPHAPSSLFQCTVLGVSIHPLDRWWIPTSIRGLRLRCIEPQRQSEFAALRCGQPVRLLIGAGAFVLDVKVD